MFHLTALILLVVGSLILSVESLAPYAVLCSTSRDTSIKISVASQRNETGHWEVTGDIFTKNHDLQDMNPMGVFLDVEHGSSLCADAETVHLAARSSVISSLSLPPPTVVAPSGFEHFPGVGYYKFHAAALTWDEARHVCVKEGAHLLIINSEAEAEVARKLIARKPKLHNASNDLWAHIGFHDRFIENEWLTVKGDPLASTGYTKWQPGEPNRGVEENCGFISKEATLFDGPCSWKQMYICEYRSY